MTQIKATLVKELRDRTGLGMMECKRALVETEGDLDEAVRVLRERSAIKADKKTSRVTAEGLLGLLTEGSSGVLVEVNSETDFVARTEKFIEFVSEITREVLDSGASDATDVATEAFESKRQKLVQELGENIVLRRVVRLEAGDSGQVHGYLHHDGKKGALVAMTGGDAELGEGVAIHITAEAPSIVRPEDMPAERIEAERAIFVAQTAGEDQPAAIIEKMVEGRVRKFLASVSLLSQPFALDSEVKVGQLLSKANAEVTGMARFAVGEGMERAESNFAEEVARQAELT